MNNRFVVPGLFAVESAQIDWCKVFEDRLDQFLEVVAETFPDFAEQILGNENLQNLDEIFCELLAQVGFPSNAAHLRWATAPGVGLPSRAFKVWRRDSLPFDGEEAMQLSDFDIAVGPGGVQVLSWDPPLAMVRMLITMPAQGGLVFACSGGPTIEHWTNVKQVEAGGHLVKIGAPNMTGLVIPGGATINSISGISGNDAANSNDWELVEVVGLPVEPSDWSGVGEHDQEQGLLSDGLVAPKDAALARYIRGRALLGWPAFIAPGILAPAFQLPTGPGLIQEMEEQILGQIREVADFAPNLMAAQRRTIEMPPPEDSNGTQAETAPTQADYSPLELLLTGATTDPNLSLILGYGTAIAQSGKSMPFGAIDVLEGSDDVDYMVTADWDQGFSGQGNPITLAALAIAPGPALAGGQPTGVSAVESMPMSPTQPDGDWRRSVRFLWQRVPKNGFFRIASYAAAKVPFVAGGQAELMNEARDSGGFRPIAASQPPEDAADEQPSASGPLPGEKAHLSAVDRVVNIPPPNLPVHNGLITMGYAACTQTIFGLWGNWAGTAITLREPNPNRVPILSASLTPDLVPAGPAPGSLTIEFGWDWSVRRPASIVIGGRLYAAQKRSDPPPSDVPTLQLPRNLGGADPAVVVSFAGEVPSGPAGSTIQGLTADGESFADFGPAQGDEIRRYRITVPGFSLDFSGTPHIGLALWARAFELRAPGRIGPWTEHPYLIAASDPRPPEIVLTPVNLASLPDARGESHGRIHWPPVANAAGYWIYEASETALRAALGLGPASHGETLTNRLDEIRQAYDLNPVRSCFTRKFAALVQGSDLDVTLPKGSRDIHFFMVLAQSQTNLDSDWPSGPNAGDQLFDLAVPQVAKPQPPILEVRRILDDSVNPPVLRALLTVTPRIGHRARRIVIFRTRVGEAAREVNTMGPPIADIMPGDPNWVVETETDSFAADHIVRAEGTDTPQGSWRHVWYRAEVWSEPNPARALLAGRSDPSPAQRVVIPPPGLPDLGSIEFEWPGGSLANVMLRWTSRAPLADTPLGPHRMTIDVKAQGTPGLTPPLLSGALPLDQIPDAAGPDPVSWWRHGDAEADGTQEYRAIVQRPSADVGVAAGIRVHDPIGRISEELVTIPAGPVDPAPAIINLAALDVGAGLRGIAWTGIVRLTETAGGTYEVSIRAEQLDDGPIFVPALTSERREVSASRLARPIATRSAIAAPGMRTASSGAASDFLRRPTVDRGLTRTVAVPDIDVRPGIPAGAPENDILIWRQVAMGKGVGFGAITGANVNRFVVRITAPDGRFAEQALEV